MNSASAALRPENAAAATLQVAAVLFRLLLSFAHSTSGEASTPAFGPEFPRHTSQHSPQERLEGASPVRLDTSIRPRARCKRR
jgi:hypothetical protein